jgi:hypothetical protein
VTKSAVQERLRDGTAFSDRLRAEASARAERFQQDASQLATLSWTVAHRPGAAEAAYRTALLQAEEALRLAPGSDALSRVLGAAQYRAGRYPEAAATLTAADRIHSQRPEGPDPIELAFLAMTQHRLGKKEAADDALARLRQTVKKAAPQNAAALAAFVREAEDVLKSR